MNPREDTRRWGRGYVAAVALLVGLGTLAAGVWMYAAPRAFAEAVQFPCHEHFLHDLAAFQLGIGATVLLALLWGDALATALAGFAVGSIAHTVNHFVDLDIGGRNVDAWLLAAVSVAVVAAFVLRLRRLDYVLGRVGVATTAELAPYVRQKTVQLTTYRKDGRTGATPVSVVVDGDHAYARSFEKALKTRRLRNNPAALLAPSTVAGRPTGPAVPVRMRLLEGAENRRAARLLTAKYPVLHGVMVPLMHRLARSKTGRTVHFELVAENSGEARTGSAGTP